MASDPRTIAFILEQAAAAGTLSARKMFGEYALYCDGVLVALVCDDRLFVNPTPAGRELIGEVVEAAPYPSAKPHLLIPGERWEDGDWLATLIRVSAAALPPAKPRKRGAAAPAKPRRTSR